ncbi:glycosyltransferase family 4 protein [Nesterenkonia aurantiaca]|uniref:Glycosyl transferase family 1 n=1 Tax=Nesterenkonia aurantiaca TaxID=1436010 RepID=A0A4R7FWA2_9MICC|nr:glycosyltransferase family 4 protein [Nesterenkonia aurantiaca]TDS83024.1 glycosyl transferase family 1 [Nesterenkonia aurantiaca]
MAQLAFIVPADLPGPSGGLTYNHRVLAQWRAMGLEVEEIAVPGAWPNPSPADRQVLAHHLAQHRQVLLDGIIGSAAPQELRTAAASGAQISVLVHLPLPAESGLSPEEAQRLTLSERAALGSAHSIVCTSAWARDDLRARYGHDRVAVAEPGVDRAALAPGGAAPRLLFLGAVTPRKNPLGLLGALAQLSEPPGHPEPTGSPEPQWSAVIAGPEGQDPAYAAAVRAAAAEQPHGRVSVIGAAAGPQLETLWAETDLLVLPSLAETYGMVVTEALARGIPALVGAGTGAQDALRGDPAGSRAELPTPGAALDPQDLRAWSTMLRAWLSDASLRQQWRDAAQAHRARLRTWSHAAQDLRTAIEW